MRIKNKKSHKKVITIVAVLVAVAVAVGLLAYAYFYPVKSSKKTEKSHRETTSESAKKSQKNTETENNSAKPANNDAATTTDDTIEPAKKQDPGAQNNTRDVPVANNSLSLTLVSAYSGEVDVTIAQLVSGTCTLSIAGQTKSVPIHENPQSSGCVFSGLSATGAFTVTATTADGTATGKVTGRL